MQGEKVLWTTVFTILFARFALYLRFVFILKLISTFHRIRTSHSISEMHNPPTLHHEIEFWQSLFSRIRNLRKHYVKESRTLEMNNVQDGIWHGRGDTICIGSFSEDAKAFLELSPHFVVSTKSPELLSMQKTSNDTVVLSASVVDHSPPLVPPPK
ncbi:UNVERIFIED_CONTAM: hypothetical protein Sangu_2233000 [Sesamum angustifolium]|uniref:Uncharacterized protein n=1 Tax=Sesamum angustifolium TaxID=2727405 RepID=A0AAW2L7Q0_9LAMI